MFISSAVDHGFDPQGVWPIYNNIWYMLLLQEQH